MTKIKKNNLLNVLRLSSQSLPTGAFSYSQGMEWLVDTRRINDESSVYEWIASILHGPYVNYELPILRELFEAWSIVDHKTIKILNQDYLNSRETFEIQKETLQMGYALREIIHEMNIASDEATEFLTQIDQLTFVTGFSFCSYRTGLSIEEMLMSHVWSFIENQILVAIKAVPLGQSAGQRLLNRIIPLGDSVVSRSMEVSSDNWANFSPLQAISSSKHETQYSRLFRS
jgi:urease accessory protein